MLVRLVLTAYLLRTFYCVKLPSNWPKCKNAQNMNDCLKNAIQIAIRDLEKGNRTLGIYPLDPWKIKLFEYNQSSGPVAVRMAVKDFTILGFKNARVDNVKSNWNTMDLRLRTPKLNILGKYAVNGSAIFLPIDGKGKFRITLDDVIINMKIFFEKYTKKGKEFLNVKELYSTPDAKHISGRFENLFNGNKVLGDRMNEVLNNNWRLILETIQPFAKRSIGEPVKIIANALFSRVPTQNFIIN